MNADCIAEDLHSGGEPKLTGDDVNFDTRFPPEEILQLRQINFCFKVLLPTFPFP